MRGFVALELQGTGDPMFGGAADDRPLGHSGAFLTGSYVWHRDVVHFPTREAAESAAAQAKRRPASLISVIPYGVAP
jgi:hypothetical protein